MRYLSLFSGVEAASVAWEPLGWEPVAFCEVDEFPAAVLAERFPEVPNLGDVTKVNWEEFHARHGAIDVLVGGSPCQSFSIAGNREGLSGESRLMFEYIRAIRELVHASNGAGPRYIIWENVPGALSSEHGNAFGQLLAELDELGYGLAWRVLDAQFARVPGGPRDGFFGPVPQRRRRVFVVGSLGTPHAAEILFERGCLQGNHPTGQKAREALAEDAGGRPGVGGCAGFKPREGASFGGVSYQDEQAPTLVCGSEPAMVMSLQSDGSTSVNSHGGGTARTAAPTPSTSSTASPSRSPRTSAAKSDWRGFDGAVAGALAAEPNGTGQGRSLVCMSSGQANAEVSEHHAPTLNCDHEQPIIAMAGDNGKAAVDEGVCGSLKVGGGTPMVAGKAAAEPTWSAPSARGTGRG